MAIAAGCATTAVLTLALPLSGASTAMALVAIVGSAAWEIRRCAGRGVPACVEVDGDRRVRVVARDGQSDAGAILDASYVGAWLTTIVWRADEAPWWQPARAVLVLPDTLPADDFRQLRVLLRYGVPRTGPGRSGEQAGRPSSQARASIRAPLSAFGWPARRPR